MIKELGKMMLPKEKTLMLQEVTKPSIIDIRLSLLFQKFIQVWSIKEYLDGKRVINIRLNNKSVGYIFLYKAMHETEVAHSKSYFFDYVIKKRYRNKKIGQNALKLLFSKDVSEKLDSLRYIAYICDENMSSIRCAQKLGMRKNKRLYVRDIEH